MPQNLTDDKSTLVQVMAWCHQATSHYLNQCWPRYSTPYGVTRSQWVKSSEIFEDFGTAICGIKIMTSHWILLDVISFHALDTIFLARNLSYRIWVHIVGCCYNAVRNSLILHSSLHGRAMGWSFLRSFQKTDHIITTSHGIYVCTK